MDVKSSIVILMALLAACTLTFAQEVGIDQIKQMIEHSAGNLTTYTYSRSSEADIMYANATVNKTFSAEKVTSGKVDLVNKAGWWSSNLTDRSTGEVLIWQGYFVNGSEYWKEGRNWTKLEINDTARLMQDYNEIPGQVELINESNMKVIGSEKFNGVDCYKLTGTPEPVICLGCAGLQLLSAYVNSPFPIPASLKNRTLDIRRTSLMNHSSSSVTAWVSKDKFLLMRMDLNSSLTVTPQILNISSPEFKIISVLNESTVYMNFGQPVKIALPKEAQNASFRMMPADWRWAVFGSVRP